MELKEWGHAAKIPEKEPRVIDRSSPLFWRHACDAPEELEKERKPARKTILQERCTFRISLLASIEEALYSSKCPMSLVIQNEKEVRWTWKDNNISEKQKFRSIALLIVPALGEAFEDFRNTLQQQSYESGRMSDPTAVLNSTRLQFFQNCLDQINNIIDKNFSKEEYPLDDLEYLISWAFTIAHNTETVFKKEPKILPLPDFTDLREEPEILPLPDFTDLRKEISEALLEGEENPDPRVRKWTSMEEAVNQDLPHSFQIVRNDRGEAVIRGSQEWREASKAGQEYLLIWTLETAILHTLSNGIQAFAEKTNPSGKTVRELETVLDEETMQHLKECINALNRLEDNISIAKEHLQKREIETFGESFKKHLQLKTELKKEIANTPVKAETANRLMLLIKTLRGIQSEMECHETFASTIRTHLLRNLHQTLSKLQLVALKTPSVDWQYQRANPQQEEAKPITFPPLGVDVPGFLDIPDLHRGFELAAQNFSDQA